MTLTPWMVLLITLAAAAVAFLLGWVAHRRIGEGKVYNAEQLAAKIVREAEREAENQKKSALLEAECVDRAKRPGGKLGVAQSELVFHSICEAGVGVGVARAQTSCELSHCRLRVLRGRRRNTLKRIGRRTGQVTSELACQYISEGHRSQLRKSGIFG